MHLLKRAVVTGLESLDSLLDAVPTASLSVDREGQTLTVKLYRYGHWGCRLNLAARSEQLDQRWKTGVWRTTD